MEVTSARTYYILSYKYILYVQRLFLSNTSITNESLLAIAKYGQKIRSISVVNCLVNSIGFLPFGDEHNPCSNTLRDLHLSSSLKYIHNFYRQRPPPHSRKRKIKEVESSDGNELETTVKRQAAVAPSPTPSETDAITTLTLLRDDPILATRDIDISYLDDESSRPDRPNLIRIKRGNNSFANFQ
jgi:hypothetical protein